MTVYERIKALCEEKGIKGSKLAEDLGLSKSLMTDLKMGRRTGVSAVTAHKIATYFGVSVGYLLGMESADQSESPVPLPDSRIELEHLTQEAIDAIRKIGAMADEEDPFPSVWATTICSALRTAVDRLEIRLLDDQIINVPFHLPMEEDDSDV